MIKVFTYRKFAITTLLFLFALILYNYPSNLNKHINSEYIKKRNIYLIDNNNYVVMTSMDYNSIPDLITLLKNNNGGEFRGVIPDDTVLLDYDVDDNGICNINFSKEIFNINPDDEELLMESLIYSLTSLDNITKVNIMVEGVHLEELPFSHKKLSYYLDRSYGINKYYNVDSIYDTSSVTVYYNKNDYYIPITVISNDSSDKVSIIITSLTSNKLFDSNLSSHLSNNVKLINYNYDDYHMELNFDDCLFDYVLDGSLKEEVKYALFYSIYDTLGVKSVSFLINNEYIDYLGLAKSK